MDFPAVTKKANAGGQGSILGQGTDPTCHMPQLGPGAAK